MLPTNRIPTHPGEVLVEEFLEPMGISQVKFAGHLGISVQRVNEIATGKRGVTPETAILFGKALGTSPEFWINLQTGRDLSEARAGVPDVAELSPAAERGPRNARGYGGRGRRAVGAPGHSRGAVAHKKK